MPFSSLVCQQNQREYRLNAQAAPKEEESVEAEVQAAEVPVSRNREESVRERPVFGGDSAGRLDAEGSEFDVPQDDFYRDAELRSLGHPLTPRQPEPQLPGSGQMVRRRSLVLVQAEMRDSVSQLFGNSEGRTMTRGRPHFGGSIQLNERARNAGSSQFGPVLAVRAFGSGNGNGALSR